MKRTFTPLPVLPGFGALVATCLLLWFLPLLGNAWLWIAAVLIVLGAARPRWRSLV